MRRGLYITTLLFLLAGIAEVIGQSSVPNRLAKQLMAKKNQRSGATLPMYGLLTEKEEGPLHARALDTAENTTITSMDVRAVSRLMRAHPALIQFDFPIDGEMVSLELFSASPVSLDFLVRTSEGKVLGGDGIHYRGIVKDDYQSIASISIYDGEIIGLVSSELKGNIVIGKWTSDVGSHVIYRDKDLKILQDFECNAMRMDGAQKRNPGPTKRSAAKCVKVYFETSYGLYQNKGNNVNTVRNYVTGLFNGVSTLYANEGLGIEISEIFVWSTNDPFNHSSSSAATASFMSQRPSFNGDIGHLLDHTGSSNGGLAYIDVLCSSTHNYAYSDIGLSYANFPTYSWTVNVVAHEIGHNYGSPHTHACEWGPQGDQALDNCRQTEGGCDPGPEPTSGGTIMSYCHVGSGNPGINFNNGFGPEPGDLLRSHAASANCLTECGSGGGGSCNLAITNIIEQDASCGENNGRLTVQISGASGAVTYDIGHGAQSSNVFNGLASGSYTVTVLNGGGCERQESATIGGGSTAPTLNAVVLNATCGQDDGQIELTTMGGSAPFSFRIGTKTQSSPIFIGLAAGDYTASVTDDGGCSSSKQLTIFTQDAASIGTEITHSSCGEENGAVSISALGGQAPFTYLLGSLQSENGSFTNLAPGSYVAQVVDQNGCSDDQNVTVNPSTAIEASLTVQNTTCGQADGIITVGASGGSGSLRYSMGDGFGTDPSFLSVAAGNYIMQVKDANQCILSLEAEVESSQAFALTSEISLPSCGLNNATIALTVDGSSGPFTYKLNDREQESPFFDQLSSGTHQITATDGDGCVQDKTIEVAASFPLEITTDVKHTRCAEENGEVTIEVSNAIGNLTYLYDNQMQAEPQFDELAPGAYVFKVQDSLGCQDSVTVQVDSSIQLKMQPKVYATECGEQNGSVIFTAVQGTSPILYNLASLSGNGFTHEGGDSIIDLLPPGLHEVFVSDADDCLYQDTIEIAPSSGVTVQSQVAHTTCNQTNGVITVEASGGTGALTIQLDTMHEENLVFDFLAARSYVLAVQDEANCVVTDTIEIRASTTPQLTTEVAHTTCGRNNGRLEFQISGGVGPYQYFVDSEPKSDHVEGLAAGSYLIMVMDSFNCVDSTVLAVRPSTAPEVSYESEPASCYQKNGMITITGSEGVLPYSYVLESTVTVDDTFLALDSGSYLLQIIDSVGCRDSAQVIVSYDDQFKKPDLISSASICEGDPAVLDAGLEMINGVAQWTHNGAVLSDTSPIIMVGDAGTYVFSINYHENCQLSDTSLVTVRQKPVQILSAKDTICRGSEFVLEPIDDQLNYIWDNGSTGATVAFDQSGRYTLTSTNIYGCSTAGEIDLEVIQPVILSSPEEAYFICEGAEMELTVDGAETYKWTSNDPDFLPTQVSSPVVSPSKDVDYQVIGLNSCFADTLDLFIGIRVREDIVTQDTTVIEGSPLVLSVEGANSGMWSSPFDASCGECTETEIRPDQQGDVYVSYEDSHGCSWQDTVKIDVIPLQDVFPRLINVITPNQDGRNDLLVFEGLDQFKSSAIQVFDQAGISIYENDAYDNTWNGQYEGGLLPEGVYFYMLTLQLDDRVFHFDSDLTLVRD